jgi:hypothetical protein
VRAGQAWRQNPRVKVATGTPSRQRAASMMVAANPAGAGERADAAIGAHVAEGRWFAGGGWLRVSAVVSRPSRRQGARVVELVATVLQPAGIRPPRVAEMRHHRGLWRGSYRYPIRSWTCPGGMVGQIAVRNKRAAEETQRVAAFYERREREAIAAAERQQQRDAYEERRRNGS